jgi:hypothetical protein
MALLAVGGCVGNIGGSAGGEGGSGEETAPLCEKPSPGRTPLLRLTDAEYANSVRDLLGVDPGDSFPKTTITEGYRSYADANTVSTTAAEEIQAAAEHVAAQAAGDLPGLLGCDVEAAGCVGDFIQRFGRRAYRRPIEADEAQILQASYDGARAGGFSASEAVAMVLEIVLQSPQFLYRAEISRGAGAGEVAPLGDHELAARLSYLLWDTLPDEELPAVADAGELADPAVLEAQARRLLDDPRAEPALARFFEDWLEIYRLDGATKDDPAYDAELQTALRGEIGAFTTHVLRRLDGRLHTLLTTPVVVVNGPLAGLYGVDASGAEWQAIDADPSERAGIVTTAAFLAAHANSGSTNPVQRGAFVRANLLCQVLHPPADLMIEPLSPDPSLTKREKLAQHRTDPDCAGCHDLMDPVGFGLENYDALGRWRTVDENDLPIDASGELAAAGEASGPFTGGIELAGRLADSEMVADCVALHGFRFAAGREDDPKTDACSVSRLEEALAGSDGDLRELMIALTRTDAFRYRIVPALEEGN